MAMPSVIPQTPGVGEKLGEAFGTGLGSGLQALANMKLQQMQQRYQQTQTEKALLGLPGITPQQAHTIANLPPQLGGIFAKDILQAPREEANAAFMQSRFGIGQQSAPIDQIAQQQFQEATPGMQQGQQQAMPQIGQQPGLGKLPGRMTSQNVMQLLSLEQGQQKIEQRERLAQQQFGVTKEKQIAKSYQDQRKALDTSHAMGRMAKENVNTIRSMLTVARSPNLSIGPYAATLEQFGLDKFFTTPTTDIMDSYINRLAQSTSSDYGTGKITNVMLQQETHTLPAAWNTREGFIAKLKNLDIRNRIRVIRDDEVSRIEKKYKQKNKPLPPDVLADAQRKIAPKLKKLAEKEIENNMEALEQLKTSPLPQGKEGDEGHLPDIPDVLWHYKHGKWHPEIQEEAL